MSHSETFDPEERAREKQASRDADAAAITSGEKTAEQVRRANAMLPWADLDVRRRLVQFSYLVKQQRPLSTQPSGRCCVRRSLAAFAPVTSVQAQRRITLLEPVTTVDAHLIDRPAAATLDRDQWRVRILYRQPVVYCSQL